jgi:hypothetical protein
MKKRIFMFIISFFLLSGLCSFPRSSFLAAQPEIAQPRSTAALAQELLETYALPAETVTERDMTRIETVIQQVLQNISESIKASGQAKSKSDVSPIMSGILIFQDWLTRQGCVAQASNWYVKGADNFSDDIFLSYPGQVPIDILFNMRRDIEEKDRLYRLLIFVNTTDLLRFASLVQNREIIVWPGEDVPYLVPSSP